MLMSVLIGENEKSKFSKSESVSKDFLGVNQN